MDERVLNQFKHLKTRFDVANLLDIEEKSLRYFLYAVKPDNMYTQFQIPKRRGGTRDISVPEKKLMNIQRKLLHILENVYTPKMCAYGFIAGKSICDNARQHVKKEQVLNIDLKDYFTQINFGRVRGMFLNKPYELGEEASTVLAQLVCYKGCLPQGAPTSPIIANMICAPLDNHFMELAKKYHLQYTRYADDITISARKTFPNEIAYEKNGLVIAGSKVRSILKRDGFEINEEKNYLRHKSERQEVTGIIVNKKINVRREYIKEIRAILHNYEFKGCDEAIEMFISRYKKNKDINDLKDENKRYELIEWFNEILKGKINFIKDVRGQEDLIYIKYATQLNKIVGNNIIKLNGYESFIEKVEKSVFILQSKDKNVQGTGFFLENVGLITNYHVTKDNQFYDVNTCKKENVMVVSNEMNLIKSDKIIDYACYRATCMNDWDKWECGSSENLKFGSELIMISYPSYSDEECANIQHVEITGRRNYLGNDIVTVSGRIVHGASGGVVLDKSKKVVGVINCGPESINEVDDTIIQGFIPINSIIQDIDAKVQN